LIGWNNRGKKTTPLRAADAARAVALIDHALSLAVAPPLVLGPPTDQGRFFGLERDRGFWATISGAGPGYSFAELNGPRTGTAYEINAATVPAGTVVWLEPGYHGDATHRRDWRFDWQRFVVPCPHPLRYCVVVKDQCTLAAVSGVTVEIRDHHGGVGLGDCTGTLRASGTTDAAGRFCWEGYSAFVRYDVCLSKSWAHGTCRGTFDLFAPAICELEQTVYWCVGRWQIVVTDAVTGSPVSGAGAGPDGTATTVGGCMTGGYSTAGMMSVVEAPPGTYTLDVCTGFYPSGSACIGHCPITYGWLVTKDGYFSCCGFFDWSCADVSLATSLYPIEPDYVMPGGCCPASGCDPVAPNCGPNGRGAVKKVLKVKFTGSGVGSNSGVPITVTWDGTKWDSGCLASDGEDQVCGVGFYAPRKPYKSLRVTLKCRSGGGATGVYTHYTDFGCAEDPANACGGNPATTGPYKDLTFSTSSGTICAPASATGHYVDAGDAGHPSLGTVEIME
jgi:hypothetical protein